MTYITLCDYIILQLTYLDHTLEKSLREVTTKCSLLTCSLYIVWTDNIDKFSNLSKKCECSYFSMNNVYRYFFGCGSNTNQDTILDI